MMIISAIMAITQIKEKKPVTDPYLILMILTFFIALGTVCKMMGVF